MKKIALILDSSTFINHLNILQLDYPLFTINEINQELLTQKAKLFFDIAIMNEKLILRNPSKKSIDYIKEVSQKTGDVYNLSEIDRKILALTWQINKENEYNPIVLTEDYAIQNVLSELDLKYKSIVEIGIRDIIHWEFYCPECNKIILKPTKNLICSSCGMRLKKKPKQIKKKLK